MFNTTGQVHFSGIKNEHKTIQLLNEWGIYETEVTHLGGTKNKADAKAGEQGISIKHKKGLNSGSFDWVNTSKTFPLIADDHFSDFNTWVRIIKNSKTTLQANSIETVRDEFNRVCNLGLKLIRQSDLQTFLYNSLFNDLDIVINDTNEGVLYHTPNYGLRSIQLLERGFQAEIIPTDKIQTSRKVVLRMGVHTVDTGLRLRLTSNNGIKAMLGMSKSNKTSIPVLKLQQDNIQRLVNSSDPSKIFFYENRRKRELTADQITDICFHS